MRRDAHATQVVVDDHLLEEECVGGEQAADAASPGAIDVCVQQQHARADERGPVSVGGPEGGPPPLRAFPRVSSGYALTLTL